MLAAARLGDEISHTKTSSGLLGGMLAGAALVAGGLLVLATGGIALPAVIAVGAVLSGAAIGGSVGAMWGSGKMVPKGNINKAAGTVFINSMGTPAARSCVDTAKCDDHAVKKIATGSRTVYIEGLPAARVSDIGECSFTITKGSPDVFIGGEQGACAGLTIESEVPFWLSATHRLTGWIGGMCLLGPIFGLRVAFVSLVGSEIGGHYGGELGEHLDGRRGRIIGSILGGIIGGGIPLQPRAASVINRLEVNPNVMSMNGLGGLRLRPLPPASPYFTRIDPRFPGRPDPHWSVDTRSFPSGTTTANGGIRNSQTFWQEWMQKRPETISNSNRFLIEQRGLSPRIDKQWVQHFPEHAPHLKETIIHHHVDQGPFAIPVPSSTHVGSGGPWHGFPLK